MTKLDRMGCHWDINFRVKQVWRFLSSKVQQARRIIYKMGRAVAGSGVDGVLKSTSSVPTVVSVCYCCRPKLTTPNQIWNRTPSFSGLEKNLIYLE